MNNNSYGYLRVAAATPRMHLADTDANAAEVIRMSHEAWQSHRPGVIVFPELCTTGYSCGDLFGQSTLLKGAERAVTKIAEGTADIDALIFIGSPVRCHNSLYNCAIVLKHGQIMGIVPKEYLPGSDEFYEYRWFESGKAMINAPETITHAGQRCQMNPRQLFKFGDATIAVEVCQDLWVPVPPSSYAALAGAELILNLSASNEALMKHDYRKTLVSATSSRLSAAYVYCSCGYGESTQDLVWAGSSLIYESGLKLAEAERFQRDSSIIYADVDVENLSNSRSRSTNFKDYNVGDKQHFEIVDCGEGVDTDFEAELLRPIEPHPFVPSGSPESIAERCHEVFSIQVMGLMSRLEHVHCKSAVIGISGGLDSTLALLVTTLAYDRLGWPREQIIGVTMPGFGTTDRTHDNAWQLMEQLGISSREIPIGEAAERHLRDIGHDMSVHDTTYENAQARERTQVLMDVAGETGGLVIGTGDLSELALGWCTYNGDHMSMYGVNASIPKTLVKALVSWAADHLFTEARQTLKDIVDTPISPELVPAGADGQIQQVTEDIVGPYELHDFFIYHMLRGGYSPAKLLMLATRAFDGVYDRDTIKKWLRKFLWRFFSQQFKRSCLPDGPKVGSVSLSPRGDLRMPSDALSSIWLSEIDNL